MKYEIQGYLNKGLSLELADLGKTRVCYNITVYLIDLLIDLVREPLPPWFYGAAKPKW